MSSALRASIVYIAILGLGGCAAGNNPSYPAEWAKADGAPRVGDCPSIAGVYRGQGLMALESGIDCSNPYRSKKGEWQCSLDLSTNLGVPHDASEVELRQPDGETLEVLLRPSGAEPVAHTLKKGKEFSCDADSLYFSGTADAFGSLFMTAFSAFLLTGGVVNHTRAFERDAEGALVMTVKGRMLFFYFGLPIYLNGTSHVRWMPVVKASGVGR